MFQKASRLKLRFIATTGHAFNVEDLWDMPLKSTRTVSLDALAMATHKRIKDSQEVSFVDEVQKDSTEQLRLDILKHVISTKQAENAAIRKESEIKAERQRLMELIDRKQNEADESLSLDELNEKLKEL
jgi:hypothetical protein